MVELEGIGRELISKIEPYWSDLEVTKYREALERWLSATTLLVITTSILLISGWVFGLDETGGYIGRP